MKGDFTRLSFDESKHYRGVLMQQGRVQLDSDWNEQVQIAEHRYSTFFSDFVGQSGTKGDDMRIEPTTDSKGRDTVLVKSGHYYVDGLLVENDSDMPLPALPADSNGLYLYYLDVWPQEVTAAEDPKLKEQALSGPDTTVRVKTEWQVRCQNLKNASVEEIRKRYQGGAWPQPQPARNEDNWQLTLSTGKMAVDKTNFQSSDNRLYRVEVRTGTRDENGKAVNPTFKWSRDNGSVVAPVSAVDDKMITIADASLSIQNAFRDAELVEVCDDVCARNCSPGYLAQVDVRDIGNGTIAVQKWLDDKSPPKDLSKPIIVRRWDGAYSGKIRAEFELEKGLKVSFADGDGIYRCGDYWLVLVRSGIVQNWTNKDGRLPDGIKHHCAALAVVEMKDGKIVVGEGGEKVTDLRVLFEPLTSRDLSTTHDLLVGGKLGVGFLDPELLRAPLSVAALNGTLLSFQDPAGCEVGRISHSAPPGKPSALSITDQDGKGLVMQNGGKVGIGTANPGSLLEVAGNISLKSPDTDICSLQFARNDENNRIHKWALWHMNSTYRKNAFEIWEYKTDSKGKDCGGDPADGAMCTPRLAILEGGNVGIGTATPSEKLEVSGNVNASSFICGTSKFGGDQGGSIELGDSLSNKKIPYIDFHYGSGRDEDYNMRIINDGDRVLSVKGGKLVIDGGLDINGGAFLGYETTINDFGSPLKSGFYQNDGMHSDKHSIPGDVPDSTHGYTHLITARHDSNNHQLQIAASYAYNDRLFFRKIQMGDMSSSNPAWYEIATRDANTFSGNQTFNGNVSIGTNLTISGLLSAQGGIVWDQDHSDNAAYGYIQIGKLRMAWGNDIIAPPYTDTTVNFSPVGFSKTPCFYLGPAYRGLNYYSEHEAVGLLGLTNEQFVVSRIGSDTTWQISFFWLAIGI